MVRPETCAKVVAQSGLLKSAFPMKFFESTARLRIGRLGGGLIGGP